MFFIEEDIWEALVNKIGYLPSQLLVTYLFLYVLLPWLFKRYYIRFTLGFLVLSYVAAVIARICKIYFYEPMIDYDSPQESLIEIMTQSSPLMVQYLIWVYMLPALTVIMVLVYTHYQQKNMLLALEGRRAQSELGFLKTQLHPHFLFNTLNNLYALSLQHSDQTVEVAKGLRKLLGYMFEKSDNLLIPLSDELDLVDTYVNLEKLRYGDRLRFKQTIDVENPSVMVIPYIFLSLVENAFKHGVSKEPKDSYILITLTQTNRDLAFDIQNSATNASPAVSGDYTQGIGVNNIRRQLELVYPDRHSYTIDHTNESYRVTLRIDKALVTNTPFDSASSNIKSI